MVARIALNEQLVGSVFEEPRHFGEEPCSLEAVDDPMVCGERERNDPPASMFPDPTGRAAEGTMEKSW